MYFPAGSATERHTTYCGDNADPRLPLTHPLRPLRRVPPLRPENPKSRRPFFLIYASSCVLWEIFNLEGFCESILIPLEQPCA